MTFTRLSQFIALLLIALVAFGGVADAHNKKKHKKKQKPAKPAATAIAPPTVRSWTSGSIVVILQSGAFPGTTADAFAPDDDLDGPALDAFVQAAFAQAPKRLRSIPAGQPVTVGAVDAAFVAAAGMDATATRAEQLITAAGYLVRPGLGSSIVARLLRLRTNLEQADDAKENAWYEQASRGDAIWSTAQVLKWGGWEKQAAIDTVELLAQLPVTTGPQHEAVQRAFDFIGMPYVWGGTSEKPQVLFGANTAGGFDCSGFMWRVLALDPTSPPSALAAFGGRTTFEMAANTKLEQRLPAAAILPADMVMFGPGGLNAASKSGVSVTVVSRCGFTINLQGDLDSDGKPEPRFIMGGRCCVSVERV